MESKYPSPCLKCDKEYCKRSGNNYKQCAEWLTWFRWWWKRFHSMLPAVHLHTGFPDKFCYSHPEDVKRYLRNGPCVGCSAGQSCDTPCRAYLQWYDARMEIVRKKL